MLLVFMKSTTASALASTPFATRCLVAWATSPH